LLKMPKDKKNQFNKISLPQETEDEYVFNLSLRPKYISDLVGQKDNISSLSIAIEATKKRDEPLEHLLLSGPPGLGKTSLAYCVANEFDSKIVSTSGPAIARAGDLIGILTNLERGDILFIDEIHRLSKAVEEFLYPAMENFQIDFVIDKGPYAKSIKFNLKPFTLIGATTREGLLSAPLRSRFGLFLNFDFYSQPELCSLVLRSAQKLGIEISQEAGMQIAKRARGTPRLANRLLRRVRDYAQVKEAGKITLSTVEKSLEFLKIDAKGLDELNRKYLKVLIKIYKGGPAGLEALSASLGQQQDTIMDVIEPYLLNIGFIKRSSRGRLATEKAYSHLGYSPEVKKGQKELF
jgi:holliday junction DNA helicase RuvB